MSNNPANLIQLPKANRASRRTAEARMAAIFNNAAKQGEIAERGIKRVVNTLPFLKRLHIAGQIILGVWQ